MKKIIVIFAIISSLLACSAEVERPSTPAEIVKDMGVGWNLGNTLDTKSADKTDWHNPEATKELVDAIRAKGYKTIRVPVTWQYDMAQGPDYTIEQSYLDRVEEVVNYGLDNDMYVIINIHHDEEIIEPTYARYEESEKVATSIWGQVAEHFKDYDYHLIFENLNEMRVIGTEEEWKGGTAEGRDCMNKFHEAIVKTVRAKGGNNATRPIMISPYAASCSQVAIDELVVPQDSNLIVAVHNYYPHSFCMPKDGTSEWGSDKDKEDIDVELDRVYNRFVAKGYAVVMGEWGSINRDNTAARAAHARYYATACVKRQICPIWWDNGKCNPGHDTFGLIDRTTNAWINGEIADAMIEATKQEE